VKISALRVSKTGDMTVQACGVVQTNTILIWVA
jgi:hypothetical protein